MAIIITCSTNRPFAAAVKEQLTKYCADENLARRCGHSWSVPITIGAVVLGDTKGKVAATCSGTTIELTSPGFTPTWSSDLLKEVSEAILTECGNAEQDKEFDKLRKKTTKPVMTYGKEYADLEGKKDYELLIALQKLNSGSMKPSAHGQGRLATYQKDLKKKGDFLKTARNTQHVTYTTLGSRELYAFERVVRCTKTRIMTIASSVLSNDWEDSFQDFLNTSTRRNTRPENVALYCAIRKIAKQGGVKAWNYQGDGQCKFSDKMLTEARKGTYGKKGEITISDLQSNTREDLKTAIKALEKLLPENKTVKDLEKLVDQNQLASSTI